MAGKSTYVGKLHDAAPNACAACPWRSVNQGKPHPDGWYTKKNLSKLWTQMRRGGMMSCHPTDPGNYVPENCGHKPAPANAETRECAGALILVLREMTIFNKMVEDAHMDAGKAYQRYRVGRPNGLMRFGIVENASRVVFAGIPCLGKKSLPAIELTDADVYYPPLGEWRP